MPIDIFSQTCYNAGTERHPRKDVSLKKIYIPKDELYHLYYEQGFSVEKCAEVLDVCHSTIRHRMREYSFNPEPRGVHKGYLDPDLLQELYWEQGLTLKEIGEIVDRAPSNVMEDMKRFGIPRRSSGPPEGTLPPYVPPENRYRGGSPGPHYVYNERFFDEWSPEMAWVLGLIFADGNIGQHSKNGFHCSVCSIDVDMLEQVRELMCSNARINNHGGKNTKTLLVCSTDTTKVLMDKYGLHPNKSRTIQWPGVPDSCLSHFVRGLWDGDGCVFVRNRKRKKNKGKAYTEITTQYVSGSKQFVYDMRDAIEQKAAIQANIKERHPKKYKPYWAFAYYHRNSLKLLEWMYRDSTLLTRLARKFERYIGALQERG